MLKSVESGFILSSARHHQRIAAQFSVPCGAYLRNYDFPWGGASTKVTMGG